MRPHPPSGLGGRTDASPVEDRLNAFVYFFQMKVTTALAVLAFAAAAEPVLGEPGYGPSYGPPKPLPPPSFAYNKPPHGAAAKYPPPPPVPGGQFNKNEMYSKYNPHGVGLQRGPPPPAFVKYPPPSAPPSGKLQYHQQQQHHQQQQPHQYQQQQQQQQPHQYQQQQQQQQQLRGGPNFRPLGPQFQSKPQLFVNGGGVPHQRPIGIEQRVQNVQQRPSPKITNIWSGPKLSGPPDFQRINVVVPTPVGTPLPPAAPVALAAAPAAAAAAAAPVTVVATPIVPAPVPEKHHRPPYVINSDDERGPIKTIPAPNLNPADRPVNFQEQLYRARQHQQQSYVQPVDNSIADDNKQLYQVT